MGDTKQREMIFEEVKCGECGAPMHLRQSRRFPKPFWGCSRFPECRGTHGAHPDGRPLGIPANRETKIARMRAHDAFDVLWIGTLVTMTRRRAYRLLGEKLGMKEVHIGEADIAMCERIIEAVEEIKKDMRTGPTIDEK